MTPSTSSPSRVHLPRVDLVAGPFADDLDANLDIDIAAYLSQLPPSPSKQVSPDEREEGWKDHVAQLQTFHDLELRIFASQERSKHRAALDKLTARYIEELAALDTAHEKDLVVSQQQFGERFDAMLQQKNGELDQLDFHLHQKFSDLGFENQQLHDEFLQLREQNAHMHQINEAMSNQLADTRPQADSSKMPVQHPNNVARAKNERIPQPDQTHVSRLQERAGGLRIRQQRAELGLPTPRGTLETFRIIGEVWPGVGTPLAYPLSTGSKGGTEEEGGPPGPPTTMSRSTRGAGEIERELEGKLEPKVLRAAPGEVEVKGDQEEGEGKQEASEKGDGPGPSMPNSAV